MCLSELIICTQLLLVPVAPSPTHIYVYFLERGIIVFFFLIYARKNSGRYKFLCTLGMGSNKNGRVQYLGFKLGESMCIWAT